MSERVSTTTLRDFIEQMDMLCDDCGKYDSGDKAMPFATLRVSISAALDEYTAIRPKLAALAAHDAAQPGGEVGSLREFVETLLIDLSNGGGVNVKADTPGACGIDGAVQKLPEC